MSNRDYGIRKGQECRHNSGMKNMAGSRGTGRPRKRVSQRTNR